MRTRIRAGVLASALASVLLCTAVPAGAHSEQGEMSVLRAEQVAPLEVAVEVGLLHEDDAHLATEASVSASLTGPEGQVVGPVELLNTTGARYAAEIEVPTVGVWRVDLASTDPSAVAEAEVEVTPQAPAIATPTTDRSDPGGPDDQGQDDGGDEEVEDLSKLDSAEPRQGESRSLWILAAPVVVVGIAAGVFLSLRKRPS